LAVFSGDESRNFTKSPVVPAQFTAASRRLWREKAFWWRAAMLVAEVMSKGRKVAEPLEDLMEEMTESPLVALRPAMMACQPVEARSLAMAAPTEGEGEC
jgi:hypothetical protein